MPLTQKTIKVCKFSAPVLVKNAKTVSTTLYEKLYKKYPEARQILGGTTEEQERKFIMSIALFSNYIDTIQVVDKPIKHIKEQCFNDTFNASYSSQIKKSLLCAMKEVLEDNATEELLSAWDEAYFHIDDMIIEKEAILCKTA